MTDDTADGFFEEHPELYDALVDWDRRLAYETPFYRRLFDQANVRRVLDVACGTGRHVAMFRAWGLEVEGADVSEAMIARCRAVHGAGEHLRWAVRSFTEPASSPGHFDAALCVGNSLALVPDDEAVRQTIRGLLAAVRPAGVCVIQLLNLWRIPEGPTIRQKCKRIRLDGADHVLLKSVHRAGRWGFVDLIDLDLSGGGVVQRASASRLLGLEAADLVRAVEEAGGTDVEQFGSFAGDPYDRARSGDLILVCRRAAELRKT